MIVPGPRVVILYEDKTAGGLHHLISRMVEVRRGELNRDRLSYFHPLPMKANAKLTALEWRFSQERGGAPAGRPSSTIRRVGSDSISGGISKRSRLSVASAVLKRGPTLIGAGRREPMPVSRERTQWLLPASGASATPRDETLPAPGKDGVKQVERAGLCERGPDARAAGARNYSTEAAPADALWRRRGAAGCVS